MGRGERERNQEPGSRAKPDEREMRRKKRESGQKMSLGTGTQKHKEIERQRASRGLAERRRKAGMKREGEEKA